MMFALELVGNPFAILLRLLLELHATLFAERLLLLPHQFALLRMLEAMFVSVELVAVVVDITSNSLADSVIK
jgi:hypothetical protein